MAVESDPPPPQPHPVIALTGVAKSFGAVRALVDAGLELHSGEAHALVGENGAGKSTLIKILAGLYRPDAGHIEMDGEAVAFTGAADALAAGIAVIYQEPALFGDLTVAENLFVGRQPRGRLGRIDRAEMRRRAAALFERLGVALDPDRPAKGLSIADQQLVEIAKAISLQARVLVMDEPTAALSGREVERLFGAVDALRRKGTAILFISHRLEEVHALCQRVTVMRDGRRVSTDPIEAVTTDELVRRMVGRDLSAMYPHRETEPGDVVLRVEGLSRTGLCRDIDFTVRAGEIVALAGLVGAGRTETVQAVFGIEARDAGRVSIDGRELRSGDPRAAMRAGVALVPEDRRQQGLLLDLSILRNATLTRRHRLSRLGFLTGGAERREAAEWTGRLHAKYGRLTDPVGTLSGGNQQKVVLAKWLATGPKLLIVDEPTRGIDIGTKAEVHRLLSDLAADGVAVLMVSSELPEVLGMADRVLVMREGRLVGELARPAATEEAFMRLASGQEHIGEVRS
nr:sugar ABC transporter ATP-binding protein [Glycomyces buryatensis]